jgi:hypothetical protein
MPIPCPCGYGTHGYPYPSVKLSSLVVRLLYDILVNAKLHKTISSCHSTIDYLATTLHTDENCCDIVCLSKLSNMRFSSESLDNTH